MCGIVGYHCPNTLIDEPDATALVESMLGRVHHRGPDENGVHVGPGVGLGHSRLSIIDLTTGRQPIADESGERWIVFNGEIYNYRKLGADLDGHTFRTRSDTEVILHLYEDLGPECVRKLEGMFAIAIWDGNGLFLARDSIGIKPLYIGRKGETLFFGSEIRSISAVAEDIQEFPADHWYHSKSGFHSYFDLDAETGALDEAITDPGEAASTIAEILERAVVKRLVADVPVGVFLSGGLDSSIIAALAKKHVPDLHTFATGVEGSEDILAARRMAEALGTNHHERTFDRRAVIEALPRIIRHLESFDLALVRSAVANYFVSGLASEHLKVVLTGEGADELFGGYAYLKELEPESLRRELVEITNKLHNTNLQRCDRMTMVHGLEGRVPFLDLEVIRAAFRMPMELKLRQEKGRLVEKWILRKAFEDILPADIAWRVEQKFSRGTGVADVLSAPRRPRSLA